MPYIVDLNRATKKLHLSVKPFGWIHDGSGVMIEFGLIWLNRQDPEPCMCMQVKGISHTWTWWQHTFYQLAKDNYADFFTKQLEEFRLDFLLWIHSPVYSQLEWVGEYYEMFKGRFYDFSEEEQKEFEKSKEEWERDQSEIDRIANSSREKRGMSDTES